MSNQHETNLKITSFAKTIFICTNSQKKPSGKFSRKPIHETNLHEET